MIHLESFSGERAWLSVLEDVLNHGVESSPRYMKTKELLCYTSVIDMKSPIVSNVDREVSYSFMFAEAWWILSGRNDVESIQKFAPSISKFSDNGIVFAGAYGPRFIAQVQYAVNCLIDDRDSRQSIINMWTPNPLKSKDIPCTITLQFLIRGDELHCVANMRSSDVWVGYIYDIFNFSCISAYMAIALKEQSGINLQLGTLFLNCGSQHLYENNFEKAEALISNKSTATSDRIDFYLQNEVYRCDSPKQLLANIICFRDGMLEMGY